MMRLPACLPVRPFAYPAARLPSCCRAGNASRPRSRPPASGWSGRAPRAAFLRFSVPDGVHGARHRDTLARLPIGELTAWYLLASCDACHRNRIVPVADLAARYGLESSLVMLIPRLRCSQCRRAPAEILLRSKMPDGKRPDAIEVVFRRRPHALQT